jgi:hypothetical protein
MVTVSWADSVVEMLNRMSREDSNVDFIFEDFGVNIGYTIGYYYSTQALTHSHGQCAINNHCPPK